MDQGERLRCGINMAVHCGIVRIFRSFLFGQDTSIAARFQEALTEILRAGEGGIFVTGAVRDVLVDIPWYDRLQPVPLTGLADRVPGLEVYRLRITGAR